MIKRQASLRKQIRSVISLIFLRSLQKLARMRTIKSLCTPPGFRSSGESAKGLYCGLIELETACIAH